MLRAPLAPLATPLTVALAPTLTLTLPPGYFVIKLRGLPWNVAIDDIATFLAPIPVPQGGVHLMNGANGRPSGLAYVELGSEEGQKVRE